VTPAGAARARRKRAPEPAAISNRPHANSLAWRVATGALGIAAFLWRLGYLSRLGATPLSESLVADAQVYWNWASEIRAHGWAGTHPFFFGPLYPYALAVARQVVGDSIRNILCMQALLGAVAVVLLTDAARRLTQAWIAIAIGLVLAFYPMAVFFDGLILMESLLFFIESLLLWWVVRTKWSDAGARAFAVIGVLIGLLAEGRATGALLLAPACALAFTNAASARRVLARSAALLAAFMVIALPAAYHNYATSREFIPFTYNFGFNLYVGNGPQATGGFEWITDPVEADQVTADVAAGGGVLDGRDYLRKTEGLTLTPAASSARWAHKAADYARRSPARVAGLALRKLGMLWNWREYAQIENADEFNLAAGPLGWPLGVSFALIGALAVAGIVFAWRAGASGRFLIAYAGVTTLGVVPFFVTDRYRHHLVPACALLAAFALERLWHVLSKRDTSQRRALFAGLAAGLVLVALPAPSLGQARYAWSLAADLGTRFLQREDAARALQQFEAADRLEQRGAIRFDRSRASDAERSDLYFNHGSALVHLGRNAEAVPWFERALTLSPDNVRILSALAEAERSAGKASDAAAIEARLAPAEGSAGAALARRGFEAAQAGHFDEAERLFAGAVHADPTLYGAWGALIRLRVQQRDVRTARALLDDARRAGMPLASLKAHEALVAAAAGDAAAANAALAQIPPEAASDPALADVIAVTRRLLAAGSLK
jgi:tetratricopeptide (TPR) repeat protein